MQGFNRLIQCLTSATLATLVAASLNLAQANTQTEDMVVYIDPVFYEHHERLLHPYYNYWFSQGPTFESVAVNALQAQGGQVKMCQPGQLANKVLALTPTIFYNPQLRRYYSTIKAHVYAGDGTLLGQYQGDGEQGGSMSVDVGLQGDMKAAYVAAMDNLMQTIKLSQDKQSNSAVKLPCQIVGAQTKPNYYR